MDGVLCCLAGLLDSALRCNPPGGRFEEMLGCIKGMDMHSFCGNLACPCTHLPSPCARSWPVWQCHAQTLHRHGVCIVPVML